MIKWKNERSEVERKEVALPFPVENRHLFEEFESLKGSDDGAMAGF